MGKILFQSEDRSCGLMSLRMYLCLVHKDNNYRYITIDGHPPYSLLQLESEARKQGVNLRFKRVEDKRTLAKANNFPIILILGEEKMNLHMVVLSKIRRGVATILDPSSGKRRIKVYDLIGMWNGIYGDAIEIEKRPKIPKPKPLFPIWARMASLILSLISSACIYFSFFYIRNDGNYLLPVIGFVIASLFQILQQSLLKKGMRDFDSMHLKNIYSRDKERLKSNYIHYYSFKKVVFADALSLVQGLLFFISFSLLMGMNNPFFLIALGSTVFFCFIYGLIGDARINKMKDKINREEEMLFESEMTEKKKRKAIKDLSDQSYKIGDFYNLKSILTYFVSFIISAIPLFYDGSFSLNAFLFYFFALMALSKSYLEIEAAIKGRGKRIMEEGYFREYISKYEKDYCLPKGKESKKKGKKGRNMVK